jgi:hypothetical protein
MRSHGMPTGAGTVGVDKMPPWARETGPEAASKWIVAVLRQVRWTEEAPSAVMIEGARQEISAAAGIKACPLREEAVAVEAA